MKPRDAVKKIYDSVYKDECNYCEQDGICNDFLADVVDSILDYLDEEAAKPKYACPMCHKIVDELFSPEEFREQLNDGDMRPSHYFIHSKEKYCKNCCENINIGYKSNVR